MYGGGMPDHTPADRLEGRFGTDLGPALARPDAPTALAVRAGYGPYRSDEVAITLRP